MTLVILRAKENEVDCKSCSTRRRRGLPGMCPACANERTRAAMSAERAMVLPACACGHSKEAHGNDPVYPLATECDECSCISYEAAE